MGSRGVALLAALTLASTVAGCGSSSGSSTTASPGGGSSGSSTTSSKASIGLLKTGTLQLAADFSVAPNQYIQNGRHVGIDPDICDATAKQLNVGVQWTNLSFDSLIPGLLAHRYDALCTGVFITKAREQVMNMVPFVQWGATIGVPKADAAKYSCAPSGANYTPCFMKLAGQAVATQAGGVEDQILEQMNTKLSAAGKPQIHILAFAQNTQAYQALTNGSAQALFVDDPQFFFFNKLHGNQYTAVFSGLDPTPLALTTPKNNIALAKALESALTALKRSGEYQKILAQWHVQAVPQFTINPPAAS
jgi:polar amino acid transport system substrate-binding protein